MPSNPAATQFLLTRNEQYAAVHGTPAQAKAAFLAALEDGCTASQAAEKAGRTRPWAYMARNEDPDFARAWDTLRPIVNEVQGDKAEERLITLASTAKNEMVRLTATIVDLKMRHRFVENARDPADVELLETARSLMSALRDAARARVPAGLVVEALPAPSNVPAREGDSEPALGVSSPADADALGPDTDG